MFRCAGLTEKGEEGAASERTRGMRGSRPVAALSFHSLPRVHGG